MKKKLIAFSGACLMFAGSAVADTLITDLGVPIDGVVTELPDGNFKVVAGDRELVYRKEEVVSIEKNAKTGALNMEEIAAAAKNADEELTAKTGLTAAQRARVDALMPALMAGEGAPYIQARDTLMGMQAECDVFSYLKLLCDEGVPAIQAAVFDTLIRIDLPRALPVVREGLTNIHSGVRAKAIELLGQTGMKDDAALIARGLVDPEFPVRIATSYALANLGYRAATPALIESLPHPDLRVSNAARESLGVLWKDILGDTKPTTVDEWNAVWSANKGGNSAVALQDLQPLADPEVPFVAG